MAGGRGGARSLRTAWMPQQRALPFCPSHHPLPPPPPHPLLLPATCSRATTTATAPTGSTPRTAWWSAWASWPHSQPVRLLAAFSAGAPEEAPPPNAGWGWGDGEAAASRCCLRRPAGCCLHTQTACSSRRSPARHPLAPACPPLPWSCLHRSAPPRPASAAILAVKAAYVQGLVLFCTSLAFLWWFDR